MAPTGALNAHPQRSPSVMTSCPPSPGLGFLRLHSFQRQQCSVCSPQLRWLKSNLPNGRVICSRAVGEDNGASESQFSFLNSVGHRYILGQEMLRQVSELPGTRSLVDLMVRANALAEWKTLLKKGVLPKADDMPWPDEPFRSRFLRALQNIQMATFTRRYPQLVDGLLGNMMAMVYEFEEKMLELEAQRQANAPPPPNSPPGASSTDQNSEQPGGGGQGPTEDGTGESGKGPEEMTEELLQEALNQQSSSDSAEGGQQGEDTLEVELSSRDGRHDEGDGANGAEDMELEAELAAMTEELVSGFEEQMEPVMSNLSKLKLTFDSLDDLLDGSNGFSLDHSMWQRTGWQEFEQLRRKLENLKELRELVRSLGRSGGRGPIRRAPAQAETTNYPPGIVRSPLQPDETRGLSRSGDLSRMLPVEAALLAAGWPRREEGEEREQRTGSRAARLLHLARRAERSLLSYERTGWLEDVPARVLHYNELRPAAEQGPIIVCLDTSGSMIGGRETVAKAVALECLRGAHKQKRACYLYAFSGPQDVEELELSVTVRSMNQLLDFLEHSFHGGTDVDEPLKLSLARLEMKEWEQADILMVTDGEIPHPSDAILKRIRRAREEMGLKVHGLLVGDRESEAMEALCSHLHVFRSWDAVKRGRRSRR